MYKQTKTQVIAHVKKHGTWSGWLAGHKVAEFHVIRGWCLGYPVKLFWDKERGTCVTDEEVCEFSPTEEEPYRHITVPQTFQDLIDSWKWYNACYEIGYYPAYYRKEKLS